MNYTNVTDFREENGFRRHMIKTYSWMFLGIVITFVTAFAVASVRELQMMFLSSLPMVLILLAAQIGVVVALSARLMKISVSAARTLFIAYSLITGITFGTLFLTYDLGSLIYAFAMAATYFGALVVIGYTTKKDLSKMGTYLLMTLIGLVIATLVNMFLANSTLDWIITYVGVLLFIGLTAYDTQKIKQMLREYGTEINENSQKMALMGSLTLYLDFINLFLYLLKILGNRK